MKRRKVLGLMGGLVGGTGLTLGSGAFTSVSADRSVTVSVADDHEAFLKLTERGEGRRSYTDGGELGFDFPGPEEDEYGDTDPEGLGTDSVYRFGTDAAHNKPGLFGVTNQGTQPVEVYSTQERTESVPVVRIYDVDSGNLLTENSPSAPLGTGELLVCGLEIDTEGVPIRDDEYDISLTISAVGTESD